MADARMSRIHVLHALAECMGDKLVLQSRTLEFLV